MEDGISHPSALFDDDPPEVISECLRLCIAELQKNSLPASPVNYSLIYSALSGKDQLLKEKIDQTLASPGKWTTEEANRLFQRYLCPTNEAGLTDLRQELTQTVAQALGSLIDIAGKTRLSNKNLEQHIDHLAEANNPKEILAVVSSIIDETRSFVTDAKLLESQLTESADEMNNLKAELDNIRKEANTDALTGLFNRRALNNELQILINDRRNNHKGFSMIMCDLDHFKKINDQYGHLIGDKVLKSFARLLQARTRSSDFITRFGGEEFVILLPKTTLNNAVNVAENIRNATERLHLKHSQTGESLINITVSCGVAAHRDGETAPELIERCDKGMYRAKQTGRNRTVIAD